MTMAHQNPELYSNHSPEVSSHRPGRIRSELCDIEIVLSSGEPLNGLGWSLSRTRSQGCDIEAAESAELNRYVCTRTLLEDHFEEEYLSGQSRVSQLTRHVRARYLEDGQEDSGEERYLFEIRASLELVSDWFGFNMPKDLCGLIDGATRKRLRHSRPIPVHLRKSLSAVLKTSSPARKHLVDAVAVQVLAYQLENMIVEDQASLSPREISVVREVFACLERFPENPPSAAELAARFKISDIRLETAFREYFGSTIHQTMLDIRFQAICDALLDGEPVKIVAYRFGYSSISNFTSAFRRHIGAPPREWLKQQE